MSANRENPHTDVSSGGPKGHIAERSASEQDLSFIILNNDGTSSCHSAESSQSLPDLTGNHASNIPPSYYQICLSDMFHLKYVCCGIRT